MTTPNLEPSAAHPPKIEILRARYEAQDGSGGLDVTEKVASLLREGEGTIHADNATFGDPTYNHKKRLSLEYTVDGKSITKLVDENEEVELLAPDGPSPMPLYRIGSPAQGRIEVSAFQAGPCDVRTAKGGTRRVEVPAVPAPIDLAGPWSLRFPPNWGAPASVTLDRLISWTDHPDAGVRYFSGTATYSKTFEVPAEWLESGRIVSLDLGAVDNFATVSINGVDQGVWWKPPFAGDVTRAVKVGTNEIEVRVTNLWANRLIGDEQWPSDVEWDGIHLARWPQWLLDQKPRPVAERLTFTTWKHYDKDSALLPSGLLGPVRLCSGRRVAVDL